MPGRIGGEGRVRTYGSRCWMALLCCYGGNDL